MWPKKAESDRQLVELRSSHEKQSKPDPQQGDEAKDNGRKGSEAGGSMLERTLSTASSNDEAASGLDSSMEDLVREVREEVDKRRHAETQRFVDELRGSSRRKGVRGSSRRKGGSGAGL